MSWRSKEKPSFFKVLSNMDFCKLLRLPPAFLRKYELTLPENVKLRADDSGRRWNVRVERMDNGLFCFTNGWEKFVEDASLKLGEFLVFSVVAKLELNVVIYETSYCKREIPTHGGGDEIESGIKRGRGRPSLNTKRQEIPPSRRSRVEGKVQGSYTRKRGANRSKKSDPLYFEKLIIRHHRSRMNLPSMFAKASNMKVKKQVRMKYVGGRGVSHVAVDPRPNNCRTDLAKGWHKFRVANGIEVGKIYSFEFNPDDQVIYVNQVDSPE